jgi:DNA-binding MarR family transcriptional regulator
MSNHADFVEVMRRWTEAFMNRSMHDTLRFARAHELSMGQYSVLMRLHHAERCDIGDVGSQLGITNAAASQMVDKLVQQGWLERTEDPADRRVKRLKLTAQGRELMQQGQAARFSWTAALPDMLPPGRTPAIVQALEDLIAAAARLEKSGPVPDGQR